MTEHFEQKITPKVAAAGFAGQILEIMAPQDGQLLPEGEQLVYDGPFGAGTIEACVVQTFVQHNMPPLGEYPGPSTKEWEDTGGHVREASLHWLIDDCSQIGSVAVAQLTGLCSDKSSAPAVQFRIRTTGIVERDAYDMEVCVGVADDEGKFMPHEIVHYEFNDSHQVPAVAAADSCVELLEGARSVFTLADILPEVSVSRRPLS